VSDLCGPGGSMPTRRRPLESYCVRCYKLKIQSLLQQGRNNEALLKHQRVPSAPQSLSSPRHQQSHVYIGYNASAEIN